MCTEQSLDWERFARRFWTLTNAILGLIAVRGTVVGMKLVSTSITLMIVIVVTEDIKPTFPLLRRGALRTCYGHSCFIYHELFTRGKLLLFKVRFILSCHSPEGLILQERTGVDFVWKGSDNFQLPNKLRLIVIIYKVMHRRIFV